MQDYNGLDKQFMSAEFKNVSLLTVENPIKRDKDRMIEDVVALRDADLNLPKELFCSTIHLKPCKSLREEKKSYTSHPEKLGPWCCVLSFSNPQANIPSV